MQMAQKVLTADMYAMQAEEPDFWSRMTDESHFTLWELLIIKMFIIGVLKIHK